MVDFSPSFLSSALLALALGGLIGLERERSGSKTAGLRSFALVSFFGLIATLVGKAFTNLSVVVIAIGFTGVLLLSFLYYYFRAAKQRETIGITTALALPLTYLLGVLVGLGYVIEAVASAIAIALLLVQRQKVHAAVKTVTLAEIIDGLIFAIIAFVIYPVIPATPQLFLGYLIDLQLAWKLVVVGSLLSFVAHLLTKYLHEKGALLAAFFGGAVSSIGVIYLFLHNVVKRPSVLRLALVVSSAGAYFADLVLILFVEPRLLFTAGIAVGATAFALFLFTVLYNREADFRGVVFSKPLSLAFVAEFAVLFFLVKLFSDFLTVSLGETGLVLSSFIGGFASSTAVFASTIALFSQGAITAKQASLSMLVGLTGSMAVKTLLVANKLNWRDSFKVFLPAVVSLSVGFIVYIFTL